MSDADESFGFTVYRDKRGKWGVYLPHQCDCWDIAGEAWGYDARDGVPYAEALAESERFIAEAHAAVSALRDGREWPAREEAK